MLDCIVVGAGPAGLTAAIYLARFKRRFLVIHNADSRAAWIPRTRNHPGFPGGIEGPDLLRRMTDQAESFGAPIRRGEVQALLADGDGFRLTVDGEVLSARCVLLATGVVDHAPDIAGVEDAVRRGLVRICPICDGFEAQDQAIGVIGDSGLGAREAQFLTTYSDDVTLIHVGAAQALGADERERLEAAGVAVIEARPGDLVLAGDRIRLGSGADAPSFDTVYSALGVTPRATLATEAGARRADDGRLVVDEHQETSVPGLFAAGDLVRGLNQISTAEAEAAIAATAIHNRLRLG